MTLTVLASIAGAQYQQRILAWNIRQNEAFESAEATLNWLEDALSLPQTLPAPCASGCGSADWLWLTSPSPASLRSERLEWWVSTVPEASDTHALSSLLMPPGSADDPPIPRLLLKPALIEEDSAAGTRHAYVLAWVAAGLTESSDYVLIESVFRLPVAPGSSTSQALSIEACDSQVALDPTAGCRRVSWRRLR